MKGAIVPIVEGHGEVPSVPLLLRRIRDAVSPGLELHLHKPIRRSRDKLLLPGELEKDVMLAADKLAGQGVVLILLDSEGDCPAELGPALMERARKAAPGMRIEVALCHREFETWFLAAASSIAGERGLIRPLEPPENFELISGAKEWLRDHMEGSRTYTETIDQPALAAIFDMEMARTSRSFDHFYRLCETLFHDLAS